jgi:hypothetical protein
MSITREEEDRFDDLYNNVWEYYIDQGQDRDINLTNKQIKHYLLTEESLSKDEINKFTQYLKDEGELSDSSRSSSPSSYASSKSSSSRSFSSSKSKSISSLNTNSSHTLLLNCCHGSLETTNINKYNKTLSSFNNPIQTLNRLIEGAQMCITSHYPSDSVNIMKELKKKHWDSLNSENIEEAKEIIQDIRGYREKTIKPRGHKNYYDYLFRSTQLHNRLQFISNAMNEKIINKTWAIETSIETKSPSGIYFVNKTTFIVPEIKPNYIQGGFDEHFNYETKQITYTSFDNILTCPIYKQFNNYCLKYKVPEKKSWEYNVHSNTFEYGDMIYETTAYALYHYLANIPNVSMIDTSCESHSLNKEVNKLKQQRDSYRKLGPKLGKKLVKKMTKKIYRIDQQLRSKARGKQRKRNTRKK